MRVSDLGVRGQQEMGEYDVFLCYNRRDQDAVKGIAGTLNENKVRPWLDVWDLRPGDVWQDKLSEITGRVKAAAGLVEAEIYAVEILEEIDHCCGSPCAPGKMTGITRTPPSTNARSNARI